jgi:hypothetical protein
MYSNLPTQVLKIVTTDILKGNVDGDETTSPTEIISSSAESYVIIINNDVTIGVSTGYHGYP